MTGVVLILNAGSSSIKFALFETGEVLRLVSHGLVEGIGTAPHFEARDASGAQIGEHNWPQGAPQSHETLLATVLDWVGGHLGSDALVAAGHRVVHGGRDHDRPARVTEKLLAELDRLTPLAPLHEPHNISPIRALAKLRPDLPQVVCFDTAFHHTMPRVATRFGLPAEYERRGVRRYGFHGLSYEYIAAALRDNAPDFLHGRVIAAHLGNGASLCAMRDGRSVDTTMGFSALDGLLMGTRCGGLDPGVVLYMQQIFGMNPEQIQHLLYEESGLLGVSGITSDMRVLLQSTEPDARDAIDLFVFRLAREAGGMASALGGVDGVVFTGGIGEHAPEIRSAVCEKLAWLGLSLDAEANAANRDLISTASSRVAIRVIRTDEEAIIARHTIDIIRAFPD